MATASSFSQGSIISFSGTPTIIIEKLNWKNYSAWSKSVDLWFLGQGFHDHLEKQEAKILEENRVPWLKLDYQLCTILWQYISPKLLEILRPAIPSRGTLEMSLLMMFNVFLIQLKIFFSFNRPMVLHIAKAKAAAEELKGLLVCNSVEEKTKRIDKLLIVLIPRSLHPDYEHVWDQILSSE
ncbi:hypothetical protein CR513_41412, partial [Mucuna pruriens]